jgi:hypothetical protein
MLQAAKKQAGKTRTVRLTKTTERPSSINAGFAENQKSLTAGANKESENQ